MNIDITLLENLEMMSLDPQITLFSFSTCKRAEHALVILSLHSLYFYTISLDLCNSMYGVL